MKMYRSVNRDSILSGFRDVMSGSTEVVVALAVMTVLSVLPLASCATVPHAGDGVTEEAVHSVSADTGETPIASVPLSASSAVAAAVIAPASPESPTAPTASAVPPISAPAPSTAPVAASAAASLTAVVPVPGVLDIPAPRAASRDENPVSHELARASSRRDAVHRFEFELDVPASASLAEDRYAAGREGYRNSDPGSAVLLSESAEKFQSILDERLPILAARLETEAFDARRAALQAKADVAHPLVYVAAHSRFEVGLEAKASSSWIEAIEAFVEAKDGFDTARDRSLEKLALADAAIAAARNNIRMIERNAAELARVVTYPESPLVASPGQSADDDSSEDVK